MTLLASLLDRLAWALLLGAVATPLLFAAALAIPPGPQVQWMAANFFHGPVSGAPIEKRFEAPWGFSVVLTNAGNAESKEVEIVLGAAPALPSAQPSHVEVIRDGAPGHELIATEEGMIIDIGPMEPGENVRVILFCVNRYDIEEVLHGGEPVEEFEALPRFDPRLRLPR